jgi:hypothetical protein
LLVLVGTLAVGCGAGAALAGCGPAGSVIHKPPQDLVLTVAEIPYPGFVVEQGAPSAGVYSDRRAAAGNRVWLRRLESAGRITGYQADFTRSLSPQQAVGPVVIESSAATYTTAAGARTGLEVLAQQARSAGGVQISTGHLGDQAVGFMLQKQFAGTSYEAFVVAWRQDNVVAGIQIEGNAATLDVNYAVTLAQLQQRQIERA